MITKKPKDVHISGNVKSGQVSFKDFLPLYRTISYGIASVAQDKFQANMLEEIGKRNKVSSWKLAESVRYNKEILPNSVSVKLDKEYLVDYFNAMNTGAGSGGNVSSSKILNWIRQKRRNTGNRSDFISNLKNIFNKNSSLNNDIGMDISVEDFADIGGDNVRKDPMSFYEFDPKSHQVSRMADTKAAEIISKHIEEYGYHGSKYQYIGNKREKINELFSPTFGATIVGGKIPSMSPLYKEYNRDLISQVYSKNKKWFRSKLKNAHARINENSADILTPSSDVIPEPIVRIFQTAVMAFQANFLLNMIMELDNYFDFSGAKKSKQDMVVFDSRDVENIISEDNEEGFNLDKFMSSEYDVSFLEKGAEQKEDTVKKITKKRVKKIYVPKRFLQEIMHSKKGGGYYREDSQYVRKYLQYVQDKSSNILDDIVDYLLRTLKENKDLHRHWNPQKTKKIDRKRYSIASLEQQLAPVLNQIHADIGGLLGMQQETFRLLMTGLINKTLVESFRKTDKKMKEIAQMAEIARSGDFFTLQSDEISADEAVQMKIDNVLSDVPPEMKQFLRETEKNAMREAMTAWANQKRDELQTKLDELKAKKSWLEGPVKELELLKDLELTGRRFGKDYYIKIKKVGSDLSKMTEEMRTEAEEYNKLISRARGMEGFQVEKKHKWNATWYRISATQGTAFQTLSKATGEESLMNLINASIGHMVRPRVYKEVMQDIRRVEDELFQVDERYEKFVQGHIEKIYDSFDVFLERISYLVISDIDLLTKRMSKQVEDLLDDTQLQQYGARLAQENEQTIRNAVKGL